MGNRHDHCTHVDVVVVVVFITLTDRAPTIFTNRKNRKNTARGCQSGSWSAGQGSKFRKNKIIVTQKKNKKNNKTKNKNKNKKNL